MHPAYYYIKYLIVFLPHNGTQTDIDLHLKAQGVAPAKAEIVQMARTELGQIPASLNVATVSQRPSKRYLDDQRIYSMSAEDEYIKIMKDEILSKPRNRDTVERLLLGGLTPKQISNALYRQKLMLPELAILSFKHYFWNTDLLSLPQWSKYLKDLKSSTDRVDTEMYQLAVRSGSQAVSIRVGIGEQLDHKKILHEVQEEWYATFLEIKSMPLSEEKVSMLKETTSALVKVGDRIKANDSSLRDTLKKFERFKIQDPKEDIQHINKLAKKGTTSHRMERPKK